MLDKNENEIARQDAARERKRQELRRRQLRGREHDLRPVWGYRTGGRKKSRENGA